MSKNESNNQVIKKLFIAESFIPILFGKHDKYIKLLSTGLNVTTSYVGGELTVNGTADDVKNMVDVLTYLLEIMPERELLADDVHTALRMAQGGDVASVREIAKERIKVSGALKSISPKTITQKHYVDEINRKDVVIAYGPAGTGKTFLAVAMAVHYYLEKRINKIILTRPAVEAGEKLGFLPGDMAEKINPYLRPLHDALQAMLDSDLIPKLIERGAIEVAPLAFMRGRTLSNAFIILDEAQNTTPAQMKMFLTRLGYGSKAIVTGDITQVDLPKEHGSGLADAISKLQGVKEIGFVELTEKDVVRHPLVTKIIMAYEKAEGKKK